MQIKNPTSMLLNSNDDFCELPLQLMMQSYDFGKSVEFQLG